MNNQPLINFHYSITGNFTQPVILFLHGFMGNSDDFLPIISVLSKNFCCLAVDLPGHGKTQVLGDNDCYTMPKTATALINLLKHLNISKCSLCGYSMGGRLGLYLMLTFPQIFHKVILESTSPGLENKTERLQRIQNDEKLAEILIEADFKNFLKNWYNQPLFKSLQNHPNFRQLIENRLQNRPVELAKSLRYMGTGQQPPLWKKLCQNQIPLLLLVGELDKKFTEINQKMANLCAFSRLEIVPNTGHNIHIEKPHIYSEKITRFLLL
ncbi:MAG TPA: 2-succinyl-6-hydroxy-2,4-cyclohexadiene-1-carboxylate synthase [Halomicronema sp.]